MRLDFLVNLRCQTSTIILPIGIKSSTRYLIYDFNYCSRAVFVRYGSYNANDVSAPSRIMSFD